MTAVIVLNPPSGELDDIAAAFHETLGKESTVAIVESARNLASRIARENPELVVLDYLLGDGNEDGRVILERLSKRHSRVPFVAVSESGSVAAVADAIRKGATDFLVRTPPLGPRVETLLQKLSGLRQWMEQTKILEQETARLHQAEDSRYHIVGESPQMTEVLRRIARVAKVPRPVLVVGERGTGKELVARAIHREGSFSKGPFVAVNCAALPHTLLESELFGHEKGAFTGAAHTTEGKFERICLPLTLG